MPMASSSVFIVNCEHISNFVLIIDVQQANVYLVHIEKAMTFEDKIGYVMQLTFKMTCCIYICLFTDFAFY